MKLADLFEASEEKMFILQTQNPASKKWEDLSDEPVTRADAEEFLSDHDDDSDPERAVEVHGNEHIYPSKKRKTSKDVPAEKASSTVHKRNKDFFDRHL